MQSCGTMIAAGHYVWEPFPLNKVARQAIGPMFIRSSAVIYPNLYLLTLGATCRYAVVSDDGSITLSDPGASAHIPALLERLRRMGLDPVNVRNIILTHLDSDRCAGMALMRRACPKARLLGTAAMKTALGERSFIDDIIASDRQFSAKLGMPGTTSTKTSETRDALHIDRLLHAADSIQIGDELVIRLLSTPGHRAHSTSYLLIPHEFIITDETLGYYRGSDLAAPGGDFSLSHSQESVKAFDHIEISGIGFPYVGAITGTLARKHMDDVRQNSKDLMDQYSAALRDGVSHQSACAQVRDCFYESPISDPFLQTSLRRSCEAVTSQLASLLK